MNDRNLKEQESTNVKRDKKHISSSELTAFKQDMLMPSNLEDFLEHITNCDYCANSLAESMEDETISAPVDMKENILNNSKRFHVQTSKNEIASKQMQLLKYSLKVITASLCAIILVLSTTKIPPSTYIDINTPIEESVRVPEHPPLTATIRNKMDQFSNEILEFTNTIINMEVLKND